jgi:hypothetical protein
MENGEITMKYIRANSNNKVFNCKNCIGVDGKADMNIGYTVIVSKNIFGLQNCSCVTANENIIEVPEEEVIQWKMEK